MAKAKVMELIVETLVAVGVKRVYGLAGDSLNGVTDAIRKRKDINWVHVRHEEAAAFAAGAEAHLTGELTVCAGVPSTRGMCCVPRKDSLEAVLKHWQPFGLSAPSRLQPGRGFSIPYQAILEEAGLVTRPLFFQSGQSRG